MRSYSVPLVLILPLTLFACGDSTAPTRDSDSGTYTATTFTVEIGGNVTDELSEGAWITITLRADGTTLGHIFAPAGGEGGADLDEDLSGTWQLTGTTVSFVQSADTFIRDMSFTASGHRLSATETFSGVTITLVLEK